MPPVVTIVYGLGRRERRRLAVRGAGSRIVIACSWWIRGGEDPSQASGTTTTARREPGSPDARGYYLSAQSTQCRDHELDVTHVSSECQPRGGTDRKSTRLNSSHSGESRMPSSA